MVKRDSIFMNSRMIPCSHISIRSCRFASNDASVHFCGCGELPQQHSIHLCEPCTLVIDVLVPYEWTFSVLLTYRLDVFDNRGIETQLWTNLCDKYSSTGRWHAIPARRTEIHKELRGRVHSFSTSVIPIRCGTFEFTARTRAPKSGNSDWIWATSYANNETIHVSRPGSQRSGLSQGAVRQLAQWFDDILMCWYVKEMDRRMGRTESEQSPSRSILAAYTAVFLSVLSLQEGADVRFRLFVHG